MMRLVVVGTLGLFGLSAIDVATGSILPGPSTVPLLGSTDQSTAPSKLSSRAIQTAFELEADEENPKAIQNIGTIVHETKAKSATRTEYEIIKIANDVAAMQSNESSDMEPEAFATSRQMRDVCEDDTTFKFDGKRKKKCKNWVVKAPSTRCGMKDPVTNKNVEFYCPSICNPVCNGSCEDDTTFRFNGKKKYKCKNWVAKAPEDRCGKIDPKTNLSVESFCPSFCNPECTLLSQCDDDASFRFNGKRKRKCKNWVAANPSVRCDLLDSKKSKKVASFCPSICLPICSASCEDDTTFKFNGNRKRKCKTWVAKAPEDRCGKIDPIKNKKVEDFCPSVCNAACGVTETPTFAPTARGVCEDDRSYRFNGRRQKSCKRWVIENPSKRCAAYDPEAKELVSFFCPSICDPFCNSPTVSPSMPRDVCEDDPFFRFDSKTKKNCATWVANNPESFCGLEDPITEQKVEFFCPSICNPNCISAVPSESPSEDPTLFHSDVPSSVPSPSPSDVPSPSPSDVPSASPSDVPSPSPSDVPSAVPSDVPSTSPSGVPSASSAPSTSSAPSAAPSESPSTPPTVVGYVRPSDVPSASPSDVPSSSPSGVPSSSPSATPSNVPTETPSTTIVLLSAVSNTVTKEKVEESFLAVATTNLIDSTGVRMRRVLLVQDLLIETVAILVSCADIVTAAGIDADGKDCYDVAVTITASPSTGFNTDASAKENENQVASGGFEVALAAEGLDATVALPPSEEPSSAPSAPPSLSVQPSSVPSSVPSASPSDLPSSIPSASPSDSPSSLPSQAPSTSSEPTGSPTARPSKSPEQSGSPFAVPSTSLGPTASPTAIPSTSSYPSDNPTIFIL